MKCTDTALAGTQQHLLHVQSKLWSWVATCWQLQWLNQQLLLDLLLMVLLVRSCLHAALLLTSTTGHCCHLDL